MKAKFMIFLKSKLNTESDYYELLSNINDIDNLSVEELVLISNTINEPYSKVINIYCDEGQYVYLRSKIKDSIKDKDVNMLKRIVLDYGIILLNDKVYIRERNNRLSERELDKTLYQDMLKILLDNDEVKLAQMISNQYLAFEPLSLDQKNIVEYLVDKDGYPISYVWSNYDKITNEIKEVIEPIMIEAYKRAIDIVNRGQEDNELNPFLLLDIQDGEITYTMSPFYEKFTTKNKEIVEQLLCSNLIENE